MQTYAGGMRRGKQALALMCALIIAIFSCGKKDPGTFTGKDKSFSARFPSGWDIRAEEAGVAVIAADLSSQSIFRPNAIVALEPVPDAQDLKEYIRGNMEGIRSVLTGFTIIAESLMKISGSPAVRNEYSYELGPVKVRVISVYIIRDGKAFVLNCSGMDEEFGALRPLFEGIISSFTVD